MPEPPIDEPGGTFGSDVPYRAAAIEFERRVGRYTEAKDAGNEVQQNNSAALGKPTSKQTMMYVTLVGQED